VPTTSSRSRARQGAHSGARGAAADHLQKIMVTAVSAIVVIVFVLVMTKAGRNIDAATQRFMLFYAGVFALIGLTGSVIVGLLATDRTILTPGHRVMAQAVHRAVSFGALAFLIIHIVTEILAQRVHVIDAFIPFLSPFRTFYIGLGTIASDLILLLVITSILRKRFTAHGNAWRWRAIHYSSYLAFVFGILHGLLGGRTAKPYVDWSYGFAIAVTALALAVRFLAISVRPKESVSAAPGADRSRASGTSTVHAAALSLAQAQLGTVQVMPAGRASLPAAPPWSAPADPFPALGAAPAYAGESPTGPYPVYSSAEAYRDLGFTPLGAPPYGDVPAGPGRAVRQPMYEPGYDGPPRFEGAPRRHVPQDELSSYPYGAGARRQQSGAGYPDREELNGPARPGPRPAIESPGARPPQSGQPRPGDRNTGPFPRAGTGPMPRADSGPMPRIGDGRNATGPMPRVGSGPMRRADSGPMPRIGDGRNGTGPMPRVGSGPMPRIGNGQPPRNGSGPTPRADSGPMPRIGDGRNGTGPMPRADSGPMPRMGPGPMPRPDTGPIPRVGPGPQVFPASRPGTGRPPRPGTGPAPHAGGPQVPPADQARGPRAGRAPLAPLAPRTPAHPSRRNNSADPRYREAPGPHGGDEWQ
jgi:DMSO/TMAO reductase YedYZ heme-binding membrane subunit